MWSLQTSIEKSFLYSYSVPETSKQETQRAGDGRDGWFTRMDEKWNSSETTQIRARLELRSLLHDPAALALPLNHALLASLVWMFLVYLIYLFPTRRHFIVRQLWFLQRRICVQFQESRSVFYFCGHGTSYVTSLSITGRNNKKSMMAENISFLLLNVQLVPRRLRVFFCSDLKLKDHCKKWFIVMHDIKFQLVPRAFSLKVGKALVTRLYQIVSRICK